MKAIHVVSSLVAAVALGQLSSAQFVTIEVRGVVQNAGSGPGPFGAVQAGDLAVWRASFGLPGTVNIPGHSANYSMLPTGFELVVGPVFERPAPAVVTMNNDFFGSNDSLATGSHPLESPGSQSVSVLGSPLWFDGIDLSVEAGLYPLQPVNGMWTISPGGSVPIDVSLTEFEIFPPCTVAASAVSRTDAAGLNATGFTATLPILGAPWTLTVAAPPAPFVTSHVLGYANPTDVVLPFGSLLVVPTGPELLSLQPQQGPLATWTLLLPPDPSLCGFPFSAQAYSYSPSSLVLHNAYDLTLGA